MEFFDIFFHKNICGNLATSSAAISPERLFLQKYLVFFRKLFKVFQKFLRQYFGIFVPEILPRFLGEAPPINFPDVSSGSHSNVHTECFQEFPREFLQKGSNFSGIFQFIRKCLQNFSSDFFEKFSQELLQQISLMFHREIMQMYISKSFGKI